MSAIPATATTTSRMTGLSATRPTVNAGSKRVLWAVLNGCDPLLLPPGSVLQFGEPLGGLVVTRVRVIVGEGGATVRAEAGSAPKPATAR